MNIDKLKEQLYLQEETELLQEHVMLGSDKIYKGIEGYCRYNGDVYYYRPQYNKSFSLEGINSTYILTMFQLLSIDKYDYKLNKISNFKFLFFYYFHFLLNKFCILQEF